MSEIERIRAEHVQDGDPGDPHCAMCSDASYPIWPCDAAILQALVSEQAREIERLREALEASRIPHLHVEGDIWFSCPMSDERGGSCLRHDMDGRCPCGCNCGAEAHNARIDAALAARGGA